MAAYAHAKDVHKELRETLGPWTKANGFRKWPGIPTEHSEEGLMRVLSSSMKRFVLAFATAHLVSIPLPAASQPPPQVPDRAQVLSAARDVMKQARYASLVTVAADGQPQARIVDPAAPGEEPHRVDRDEPGHAEGRATEEERARHARLFRSRDRVLRHPSWVPRLS